MCKFSNTYSVDSSKWLRTVADYGIVKPVVRRNEGGAIMAQTTNGSQAVECPCCGARLIIDIKLGKVVRHEEPQKKSGSLDFDHAHNILREQARHREEIFSQSSADLKIQSELLDRKFAEALKKSKESPVTRPTRDIDLD